ARYASPGCAHAVRGFGILSFSCSLARASSPRHPARPACRCRLSRRPLALGARTAVLSTRRHALRAVSTPPAPSSASAPAASRARHIGARSRHACGESVLSPSLHSLFPSLPLSPRRICAAVPRLNAVLAARSRAASVAATSTLCHTARYVPHLATRSTHVWRTRAERLQRSCPRRGAALSLCRPSRSRLCALRTRGTTSCAYVVILPQDYLTYLTLL
ncbi:hypothetical protein DFH06DRAFT_1397221, partial [Mycena polygramma]